MIIINQSKITHKNQLKGELPDLDSKIDPTLGVDDGGHRRRLTGGNSASDSVTRDSNPNPLALQPLHPHLHLRVHLNLHREPFLAPLKPRSQASQRIRVQILRTRQHRTETRLVVLAGIERRQRPVPDGDSVGECRYGEGLVGEYEVVVWVLGDECEVEECG